jgi:PAS domain S-box-containing protein
MPKPGALPFAVLVYAKAGSALRFGFPPRQPEQPLPQVARAEDDRPSTHPFTCTFLNRLPSTVTLSQAFIRPAILAIPYCHLCVVGYSYRPAFLKDAPLATKPFQVQVQDSTVFTRLVESIKDYGIFVLGPEGHVLTWNSGAQAIKGYAKEEIIGKHFSVFYPEEAVQAGWPSRELALAEKEGWFADEGWRVRKDGTTFWASVIITALHDPTGALSGFSKITLDLTTRRQNEERIQALNKELRTRVQQLDESQRLVELRTLELQKLSARLMNIQDEERRRIARELHDDLGQQLAGLKMLVDKSGNQEAVEMLESAIGCVRNLSYLLHPPLLDETGLRAALHWLVDGLAKRSGIEISLTVKPQWLPRMPQDIETTVFRVVQEALTNVYRHSGSTSVRIEIEQQSDFVLIRVRDYGKGLPSANQGIFRVLTLGVGITGMKERVRQFGGELTVSNAEPGTLVEAKIPMFG